MTDEFGGSGPVDSTKWDTTRATTGFAANGLPFNPALETSFYGGAANVTQSSGSAVFTVRAASRTLNGQTFTQSSGMIHAGAHHPLIRTAAAPNVYVEARVFLPAGATGIWPALWLVNSHHDDATYQLANQAPEIDAFEFWADGTSTSWQQPWFNLHLWNGTGITNQAETAYGSAALGGWHTYAVLMDASGTTPYFDGIAGAKRTYVLPIGQPLDLIFNLATAKCHGHGSMCPSNQFASQVGLSASVDYIRTYTGA